jgi:hypothetical protein
MMIIVMYGFDDIVAPKTVPCVSLVMGTNRYNRYPSNMQLRNEMGNSSASCSYHSVKVD